MDTADCRRFYAEEIRFAANVKSPALVKAFASVAREKFLGSGPWELGSPQARAMSALGSMKMSYVRVDDPCQVYHNVVVALDREKDINNGQPSALACWIDALDLRPGTRVYHLGCGVGYYTAIIAEVVGTGGTVVASEVNLELADRAKQNLACYSNVTVHAGDGVEVDPDMCDGILINAGVTHPLPLWLGRLPEGGRLVVPLTTAISPSLGAGFMTKIVCEHGRFSAEFVSPVAIYSCTSARDPQREPLLKACLSNGALIKMKSIRLDIHVQTDSCLVHGPEVCVSAAEALS